MTPTSFSFFLPPQLPQFRTLQCLSRVAWKVSKLVSPRPLALLHLLLRLLSRGFSRDLKALSSLILNTGVPVSFAKNYLTTFNKGLVPTIGCVSHSAGRLPRLIRIEFSICIHLEVESNLIRDQMIRMLSQCRVPSHR